MVTPLESVKTKLPLPPVVFLVTTTLPLALLAKLQVAMPPAVTVTVTLGLVPGGEPGVQLARSKTNPGSTLSLTVYVPGASALKVVVPMPAVVEIVADMVTLFLRVNTKLPLPPVVFLVTTTLPLAELAKLQVAMPPAGLATVRLGLVPGGGPGGR